MRHAASKHRSIRDELESDLRNFYPDLYHHMAREKPRRRKRSLRWQDRALLILASVLMLALLVQGNLAQAQELPEFGIQWGGGVATAMDTEITVDITGLEARTEVTQVFRNNGSAWAEAVYRFPLPEGAAVDQLFIEVGNRILVGEIQEKQTARRTYQQARSAGQTATLVEQQRPNQFETRLANIGPGEQVKITIGFLSTVDYADGAFAFRFPMTFTPRGGGENQFFEMERAPRPVFTSFSNTNSQDGHRVQMAINLRSGFTLSHLESLHHDVDIHPDLDGYSIFLDNASARADRMFELKWSPELGATPGSSLMTWDGGDAIYAMLMLAPPLSENIAPQAREVIFVIDTSGSMEGESLRQARQALLHGLTYLSPDDRFNVIQFNSTSERLFERSQQPGVPELEVAGGYIQGLHANGGTNMGPALDMAMKLPQSSGLLRQIVFITDGSVGNEHDLLLKIGDELGDSRLFTVSIGTAPNTWFMNKAAVVGRGSHTQIGRFDEVEKSMSNLWGQIQSPALTDICVDWGMDAEFFPEIVPDLYGGQPLWVYARLPQAPSEVMVCGELDGANWEQTAKPLATAGSETLSTLWARSKIEALEDSRLFGTDPEWVREQVTDLALDFGLLTQYTSLVAVDKTPVRPVNASLERHNVPSLLPAGSTLSTGFAATAAGWKLQVLLSLITLLIAGGLFFFGTGQFSLGHFRLGQFGPDQLDLGKPGSCQPMAPSTPPQSQQGVARS